MATESRVKKSFLNARVNMIFYFLTLALSFFSRKIFLDTLGADFVGLTGTLQNLLGFLNLAELGISSAIGYVLYKPIFENDRIKINEIISVMGYLYRWIGLIILFSGIVLSCFLPLLFPEQDTGFKLTLVYFAYYSFLASSLIGYFINYRQNLLGADQKEYEITAYFQTTNIIKILIQLISAYYTRNYYLWVAIELSFGVIYSFILNWRINKVYPWLHSEIKQGKLLFKKYPEVIKYVKQLFVHKIGGFAQNQMSPIIVYACVSLQMVAYYGNYTILLSKISALFGNLMDSTTAGVGNLIAEGSKDKIFTVYWELSAIRYYFAGIVFYAVYNFFPSFITIWLGNEYVLPNIVLLLLACNHYISLIRGVNDQFIYGYGLFYDLWAPITETIIGLVVSFVCGCYYGLAGVVLGNVVSRLLIIVIWKSYFLFSKGLKQSYLKYWLHVVNYILVAIVAYFITNYVISIFWKVSTQIESYGFVFVEAFFSILLFAILYFIGMYFFCKGTKNVFVRMISLVKSKLRM